MRAILHRCLASTDHARDRLAWLGPLLVRLAVGWTFMMTGWGKLHHLDAVAAYFASLHLPAPALHAHLVAALELGGGVLLLAGALTRWAALPLVGVMAVAVYTAKWPELHGVTDLLGTEEVMYLAALVWLALAGGGAASVDAAWRRARRTATLRAGADAPSVQ